MTRQEEKQRLRHTMRALERQLSEKYRAASGRAICDGVLAMPAFQAAGSVFCFVGTGAEIDTRPILAGALAAGKALCVPRCAPGGIMELRQVTDLAQLAPGAFGIPEPPADSPLFPLDEVDLAVIPCLACNHLGQRLGRGGGYYDRFLAHYRGGTVLVCREKLIREEIPLEPHDYPVPWVLTERALYEDGTPARLG